jgi:ribonucleoside-diphosphate reductase alpha chain
MGHIKMMGATQPFISGAISKTVNVPKEATVEEIMQAYIQSWKLGAKAISIYRDGSKRTQPLNTSKDKSAAEQAQAAAAALITQPIRRKLPDERQAITHKFDIAGHEGYITVGLFANGQPGEIFLVMAKEGSTISGFADAFAQAISYALQYGVPLQALVDKFSHVRFEPSVARDEVPVQRGAVPRRRERPRGGRERRTADARADGRGRADPDVSESALDDSEPGRRAAVLHLRLDHDPQRRVLQVQQLREYVWMRLSRD